MAPFILLYVCNLSSKSLPYSDMRYPKYLKSVTCSIILSFITIFTLCMWFSHNATDFVFVLDMVILYFLAIRFKWYAIVCQSSSDVAIKIWSYFTGTAQTKIRPLVYIHRTLVQNWTQSDVGWLRVSCNGRVESQTGNCEGGY